MWFLSHSLPAMPPRPTRASPHAVGDVGDHGSRQKGKRADARSSGLQRWSIENEWHWARDTHIGEDTHRYANRLDAAVFAFCE
jgi:hypothetical protein